MRGGLRILALTLALMASGAGASEWRDMPWHLADHTHFVTTDDNFDSLEVEATIHGRVEAGDFLYIAPVYGKLGGEAFYFGLQTDLYDGRDGSWAGPGLIFSRWGNGDTACGRPAEGGWTRAPEGSSEGTFVGVRRPYDWKPGTFTFLLQRRPWTGGGPSWVDLLVFDHARGQWLDAGGLCFPPPPLPLRDRVISFIEVYGPQGDPPPPEDLPAMTLRLRGPRIDQAGLPRDGRTIVPKDVPPVMQTTGRPGDLTFQLTPPQ